MIHTVCYFILIIHTFIVIYETPFYGIFCVLERKIMAGSYENCSDSLHNH